jgi:hypothetical protein
VESRPKKVGGNDMDIKGGLIGGRNQQSGDGESRRLCSMNMIEYDFIYTYMKIE